jgi:hypothetical protein
MTTNHRQLLRYAPRQATVRRLPRRGNSTVWVFIKSSPQKIIADGTDWRFLNELKRELKA